MRENVVNTKSKGVCTVTWCCYNVTFVDHIIQFETRGAKSLEVELS
jgi:hypothetical protein